MRKTLLWFACVLFPLLTVTANPVPRQTADDPKKEFRLLYFTADWCGPCQLMQRETWPVPSVRKELGNYDLQQIDIDEEQEVAEQWGVRSIPTFIVAAAGSDRPLVRVSGFMDGDRMTQWLRDARTGAAETLRMQKELEEDYAEMSTALTSMRSDASDTNVRKAREALFTLLARREDLPDASREALRADLQAFALSQPAALAEGLLHEDLQVRVHVSRALSREDFYLDPWASIEKRREAVAHFNNARSDAP